MMKIGILVLATPNNGGTFQYTLSFVEGVKRLKNCNITLYTSSDNPHYNNLGLPINRVMASSKKRLSFVLQPFLEINKKKYFEEENILLAPIFHPILLNTKTPFVYTLHDLQEHYYPEYFSIFQRIWRNYINKQLIKKSVAIICESFYVKNDIIRLFDVLPKKIFVIPSPPLEIEKKEFTDERTFQVLQKHSIPDQYFFYPAQFWPHKNHIRLIEAFNMVKNDFPNVYLVLTGAKKENKTYQRFTQIIKELDLSQKVIHLGYVEYSELEIIFKHSICLILPTLFESISIPVYEAFQLGVPVCASSVVGLPEQIGDAGILFDPLSTESIYVAISQILGSASLRDSLRNKGYKRLLQTSYEGFSNEMMDLLASISITVQIN